MLNQVQESVYFEKVPGKILQGETEETVLMGAGGGGGQCSVSYFIPKNTGWDGFTV
jgi:hypothetical protein